MVPLFVSIIIFSGGPVLAVTIAFHEGFTHNICRKTKELPKFDPDNGEVTGDFMVISTRGGPENLWKTFVFKPGELPSNVTKCNAA